MNERVQMCLRLWRQKKAHHCGFWKHIHDAFMRDPCTEVARLIFRQLLKIETKSSACVSSGLVLD